MNIRRAENIYYEKPWFSGLLFLKTSTYGLTVLLYVIYYNTLNEKIKFKCHEI